VFVKELSCIESSRVPHIFLLRQDECGGVMSPTTIILRLILSNSSLIQLLWASLDFVVTDQYWNTKGIVRVFPLDHVCTIYHTYREELQQKEISFSYILCATLSKRVVHFVHRISSSSWNLLWFTTEGTSFFGLPRSIHIKNGKSKSYLRL